MVSRQISDIFGMISGNIQFIRQNRFRFIVQMEMRYIFADEFIMLSKYSEVLLSKSLIHLADSSATRWCRRGDLNSHGSPHTPLKRACLPIPPLRLDITIFILCFLYFFNYSVLLSAAVSTGATTSGIIESVDL